ncbi:hypothetical protein [Nocardioides bizhenqiangii]|uniref:DUF3558 domain-containing protein n=1 Tax=Nocardioides bizhenqiangii TaxID=3095076 RepID=A0ABZ0ZTD7_9ACTN|nr:MULTISPECIES: hypothetical protein [unclassified Nocardioides]MDZ5619208.1 hypothetical protein [Nocardioides sp. HM23]WQQ26768.1 hypothetical protein SHK19_00710 [Nocardioides sp. HM61]
MREPLAAVAVLVLLAGCGDGEDVGEKPDLPDETPALWNPCDVLDARFVEKNFGTVAEESNGEPTQPECRFVPAEDGEPAVTVNYLLFSGTLDEAWETMDISPDAKSTSPDIEGADEARIVVNAGRKDIGVTGFVANGDLIQSVNVVDPAPYDEQQIIRGVRATLTVLSQHAVESGVEDPA